MFAKKKPEKKKKSIVGEFSFYYIGTLVVFYVFDKLQISYPGRTILDHIPYDVFEIKEGEVKYTIWNDPQVYNGFKLIFLGFLLTGFLHLWRQFIKSFFVKLARDGSGLPEGTLKHDKFLEQCWLAVHYTIAGILEIYALKKATKQTIPPLLTADSRRSTHLSTEEMVAHNQHPAVLVVYLLQFSFYSLELLTLFLDKNARRRSDAFVYAFHHLLTVYLIGFSLVFISSDCGLIVLFCHDIGDIFLPIAKCFLYTEDHAKKNFSKFKFKVVEALGVFFFICFLISFGFLRLVLYPIHNYVAVYQRHWNTRSYVEERDGFDVNMQKIEDYSHIPSYYAQNRFYLTVGLILLQPLHVYWFRLLLRVAYRAVLGLYDDERSDDEQYSDEDKDKKEK